MAIIPELGNRTIIHTVHDDNGGVEVYFARTEDDLPARPEQYFNSVQIGRDGALLWKGWTDKGYPIVVGILNNRVVVAATEDMEMPSEDYDGILFDSAKVHLCTTEQLKE